MESGVGRPYRRHRLPARYRPEPKVARLFGLTRSDVSQLLRGDFRAYSLEHLLRLVTALDRDIDIVIRKPAPGFRRQAARRHRGGRLTHPRDAVRGPDVSNGMAGRDALRPDIDPGDRAPVHACDDANCRVRRVAPDA